MPPALSDEENGISSGEDEIPYRGKGKAALSAEPEPAEDVADDEGADEEEGEEEYVVEKIRTHRIRGDTVEYRVKWLGFDKKSDETWEPEENMDGAIDILKEYWEEVGGRPEPGKPKKKRGRKSAVADDDDDQRGTPASNSKRAKKASWPKEAREWEPPVGSWENDVELVDTVGQDIDAKTGESIKIAYIVWTDGRKTQHPLWQAHSKCPQKMLQYYESHLVFSSIPQDSLNGEAQNEVAE